MREAFFQEWDLIGEGKENLQVKTFTYSSRYLIINYTNMIFLEMVANVSLSLIGFFFSIELLMLFGFDIRCPNIFKLSILQENKWKVG
jgi:hypothetical protein